MPSTAKVTNPAQSRNPSKFAEAMERHAIAHREAVKRTAHISDADKQEMLEMGRVDLAALTGQKSRRHRNRSFNKPMGATATATATAPDEFEFPPLPETRQEFEDGVAECYAEVRRKVMDHLRLVWEVGRWLDAAREIGKRNGWPIANMLRQLREDEIIRWQYPTVRAYCQLSREDWKTVAKSGSVRKALSDMRARNRTPEEQVAHDMKRARSRHKDKTHAAALQLETDRGDQQAATIRQLREEVRKLRLAVDPQKVADLEAVVASHAEAEEKALARAAAAEATAEALRGRVARVEREAAHLRNRVAYLEDENRGLRGQSDNGVISPNGQSDNGVISPGQPTLWHSDNGVISPGSPISYKGADREEHHTNGGNRHGRPRDTGGDPSRNGQRPGDRQPGRA